MLAIKANFSFLKYVVTKSDRKTASLSLLGNRLQRLAFNSIGKEEGDVM